MVSNDCSRSHGQPEPGVRSAAMISMRRPMSRDGFTAWLAHDSHKTYYGILLESRIDQQREARPLRIGRTTIIGIAVQASKVIPSKPGTMCCGSSAVSVA